MTWTTRHELVVGPSRVWNPWRVCCGDVGGFSRGNFEKLRISGGFVGSCVLRILPPMRPCASTTTALIPFSLSSRAAVTPAGPAPITTTPTFMLPTKEDRQDD